jgi:hypothetical protein
MFEKPTFRQVFAQPNWLRLDMGQLAISDWHPTSLPVFNTGVPEIRNFGNLCMPGSTPNPGSVELIAT